MKRITLLFLAVGLCIPIVVIAWDQISPGNYPPVAHFLWPTMILLLPFGAEPYGWEKVVTTAVSILLNGTLYAIIGLVIGAVADRARHPAR